MSLEYLNGPLEYVMSFRPFFLGLNTRYSVHYSTLITEKLLRDLRPPPSISS